MGITKRIVGLGLIGSLTLAMGCERGDTRLDRLTAGMSKDSALAVMSAAPQRNDPFLIKGQYIEALYFPRQGATDADADAFTDRLMSPVVVINGTLTGWGWGYWDSVATANNIQVAAKQ